MPPSPINHGPHPLLTTPPRPNRVRPQVRSRPPDCGGLFGARPRRRRSDSSAQRRLLRPSRCGAGVVVGRITGKLPGQLELYAPARGGNQGQSGGVHWLVSGGEASSGDGAEASGGDDGGLVVVMGAGRG